MAVNIFYGRKFKCVECGGIVQRCARVDSMLEKWECENCGDVETAYV